MATKQAKRPDWYTSEDDTAWEKVKAAFARDWQQTKHDFGAKEPNLNQQVTDTVGQAAGSKPIPRENVPTPHPVTPDSTQYSEADEDSYRYGYAAYRHFGTDWDDSTEANLQKEWDDKNEWERRREAVRRGYLYGKTQINRPR